MKCKFPFHSKPKYSNIFDLEKLLKRLNSNDKKGIKFG
jgi:hypothetical protein